MPPAPPPQGPEEQRRRLRAVALAEATLRRLLAQWRNGAPLRAKLRLKRVADALARLLRRRP
jgi:hypothetical protein